VKGLNIFEELTAFEQITKPVNDNIEKLNIEFASLKDSEKAKQEVLIQFQERYLKLVDERRQSIKDFVVKNPKSFISLYHLNSDLAHEEMNVPEIQSLYDALPDNLKENVIGKMVQQKL